MAESLIATMLGAELLATFEDPEYRPPPLPGVALELMALSGRDDAKAEQVVRLLEQDEMLAGGVNEAGELVPGDRVSDLDFELSREALGLDDNALGRILADAEALVPDILWL